MLFQFMRDRNSDEAPIESTVVLEEVEEEQEESE